MTYVLHAIIVRFDIFNQFFEDYGPATVSRADAGVLHASLGFGRGESEDKTSRSNNVVEN